MERAGRFIDSRLRIVAFAALPVLAAAGITGLSEPASASRESQSTPAITEGYWQQEANYDIGVTLDTEDHLLAGSETITYRNNSPDTLSVFYLHLYPNAFRDKTSPLIRDYLQGTLHFFVGLPKSMRGWIDISELSVDGAFASFTVDGTILSSGFPKPLLPGATATITLTFEEKVMKRLGRAGYAGTHYDMAQWYPKMVVYDKNGWHADQYRMGEFYGEFGTFDVRITLPEKYVIAATGVPVEGDPGWNKNPLRRGGRPGTAAGGPPGAGRGATGTSAESGTPKQTKTVHFHAENVHDFAWCADPSYVVQDTLYNGYRVMSFFRPWNRSWVDTTLAQTLRAMKWLEENVGPYPYPQVSVVDSPTRGGMEYPMLAMDGYVDESLVIHEVSHNYFYGILANDERAEAWLDEGFVQYMTFWYAEDHYGPFGGPDTPAFPFSLFPRYRMWDGLARPVIRAQRTGWAERVSTPVQEFKNGYDLMPYVKAPIFLRALRYTVGDSTFAEILRAYYDLWKFKHVDEEAFRSVCEEVSGKDLGEMFKEWLHTTKSCDYRLSRFKTERATEGWSAAVKIDRTGELIMPLTLAFRLKNGNTVNRRIDGLPRTTETTFHFDEKPVSAAINPDNEILDVYRIDNYLPRRRRLTLDVPFNRYYPPDAYSLRLLPIGYYNDVDGGKAGLRLRGSYDDYYRKVTLQGLYGFESEKVDFYASLRGPARYFGKDASYVVEGFNREGRRGASIELDKIQRKSLFDPLARYLEFRVAYHELTDSSYVFPFTYEEGLDIKASIGLTVKPRTDLFASGLTLTFERSLWGSDFNFEKFRALASFSPAIRYMLPIRPYLRFFLGRAAVDPPLQERFNLAGANTLERENRFWLRSVGAFPKDQYNNFHVAGDANLRGYYDATSAFKKVFASNIELELPLPLPVSRTVSRVLDRRLYLFYDWGKVSDERPLEGLTPDARRTINPGIFDGMLSDFGIGLSLWRLTAEFPLYLNHPCLVGEQDHWDFRWTIGFNRLF
jgi:hypothetical protein